MFSRAQRQGRWATACAARTTLIQSGAAELPVDQHGAIEMKRLEASMEG